MKVKVSELSLNRWPYGMEVHSFQNGLVLRPRRKARVGWGQRFRNPRPIEDGLGSTRQLANDFDAKEWRW